MKIYYDDGTDLLYLRFDEREQQVQNRKVADDIVLDIGENGKIVGIEILDASRHVNLQSLLPTHYQVTS